MCNYCDTAASRPIVEAFERRKSAYLRYNALPSIEVTGGYETPEEKACWSIIDAAELTILEHEAADLRDVEIKLWAALYHTLTGREEDCAVNRGDLHAIAAFEDKLDWNAKLIVSALRSLRTLEATDGNH